MSVVGCEWLEFTFDERLRFLEYAAEKNMERFKRKSS